MLFVSCLTINFKLFLPSKTNYSCLNRESRRKLIKGRNKGSLGSREWKIYHPAMEWKEVLQVWRVGFHFRLIQCEVFKTHEFGEINEKARLFPQD